MTRAASRFRRMLASPSRTTFDSPPPSRAAPRCACRGRRRRPPPQVDPPREAPLKGARPQRGRPGASRSRSIGARRGAEVARRDRSLRVIGDGLGEGWDARRGRTDPASQRTHRVEGAWRGPVALSGGGLSDARVGLDGHTDTRRWRLDVGLRLFSSSLPSLPTAPLFSIPRAPSHTKFCVIYRHITPHYITLHRTISHCITMHLLVLRPDSPLSPCPPRPRAASRLRRVSAYGLPTGYAAHALAQIAQVAGGSGVGEGPNDSDVGNAGTNRAAASRKEQPPRCPAVPGNTPRPA